MHVRWRRSLASLLALTGIVASSLFLAPATTAEAAPALPTADIIDLDLSQVPAVDRAQNLPVATTGAPSASTHPATGAATTRFDGKDDSYIVALGDQYRKLENEITIECAFSFEGTLPVSNERNLCAGKEAGGYSLTISNDSLTFMAHVGGGYKTAKAKIEAGRWYHSVATWDGATLRLFIDGALASEVAASGALGLPPAAARGFAFGADINSYGGPQAFAEASIATARVYSSAVGADQVAALYDSYADVGEVADADVLDVTFEDGTATDRAQNRTPNEHGTVKVSDNAVLDSKTVTFDGVSALRYPFASGFDQVKNAMTVQCAFRFNGPLPANEEQDLCSAKEAGGFGIVIYDDRISFIAHIGGGYKTIGVPIKQGIWYNATATWDGATMKLYVNGALAAETAAKGTLAPPSNAEARNFVIGGDAATRNGVQSTALAEISSARVYSRTIGAAELTALNNEAIAQPMAANGLTIASSVPAKDQELNTPTTFDVSYTVAGLVNEYGTQYLLDGVPIKVGDGLGSGLKKGKHAVSVKAQDIFGRALDTQIDFRTGNIVSGGGAVTQQGKGSATLSAIAINPSGGKVDTTFLATDVAVATAMRQGSVGKLPTTLEFEADTVETLAGTATPNDGNLFASTSSGDLPFQRFDVAASASDALQEVVWTGSVDPQRSVALYAWNAKKSAWQELNRSRGIADAELSIAGMVDNDLIDAGTVHLLVVGDDPFADDIGAEIDSAFADPDDYDFSIAHLTDTQYLSEGAIEQETAEERAVWQAAYTDVTKWIADNAAERKIAYAAHTGDIIEDWVNSNSATAAERAHAAKEFEFASSAQKVIEDAGVVNSVLPGNHDNRTGRDNGADNLYNQYFGPDRYEAQEKTAGWQKYQASHTEWKPGDNDNHYDLFSVSGLDFVAVSLGFDVTEEEATWARGVLQQYKDRNAIVLTHAYNAPSNAPTGRGASFSHDGKIVFEQVLNKVDNVFLVLSGHEHGVSIMVRKDVGASRDRNIVELLADYQFYKVGSDELGLTTVGGYSKDTPLQFGASFFRLLQFDIDRAEMIVDTYSPLLDNFGATEYDDRHRYNGTEDDFTIPIDLSTRSTSFTTDGVVLTTETDEVIGTATSDSGWPASISWEGLTEGKVYGWRALSRDAADGTELRVWRAADAGLPFATSQSSVFLATAAGTDKTAPVITAPTTTTIKVGDPFDPMAGVTVVDNTDGDLSAQTVVSGTWDAQKAGTYVLLYQVADTNGNQAIAARALIVKGDGGSVTPEPTAPVSPKPSASSSPKPTSSTSPSAAPTVTPTPSATPSRGIGHRPGLPSTGDAGSGIAAVVAVVVITGGLIGLRRTTR